MVLETNHNKCEVGNVKDNFKKCIYRFVSFCLNVMLCLPLMECCQMSGR